MIDHNRLRAALDDSIARFVTRMVALMTAEVKRSGTAAAVPAGTRKPIPKPAPAVVKPKPAPAVVKPKPAPAVVKPKPAPAVVEPTPAPPRRPLSARPNVFRLAPGEALPPLASKPQ